MEFFDFKRKLVSGIKDACEKTCQEYGLNISDINLGERAILEYTTNLDFGDYATNVAMVIAQKYGVDPVEIGQKINDHLKKNTDLRSIIKSIEVVRPGFINIVLNEKILLNSTNKILDINQFKQKLASLQTNKKVLVEHTSPNTNKSLHIGHLRNNLLGMTIIRLLRVTGNDVISDCLYNDRGIHISKAMWGYLKKDHLKEPWKELIVYWHIHKDEWPTPKLLNLKPDHFVENFYKVGAVCFRKYPTLSF